MKKTGIVTSIILLVFVVGCTLEASFEPDSHKSNLSLRANGNNPDGSISEGGHISIKIIGEDYDGISNIILRIPALQIEQEFRDYSNNDYWEINQTFSIGTIDFDAPRRIYITLVDEAGEEYSRVYTLNISE